MTFSPYPLSPTPEQLLKLHKEAGIEYVGGRIVEKSVSIASSLVTGNISSLLLSTAMQTGEAHVFSGSLGYRCNEDEPLKFRKPSVSLARCERMAGIDFDEPFMPILADLVVEVLPAHDPAPHTSAKVQEYLEYGFGLVWVVRLRTSRVTVYRPEGTVSYLEGDDEITGDAALPTFRCPVSAFFGD